MKTLTTTIEIDEIETEIEVEFTNVFGDIVIDKITEISTGDAICPDLFEKQVTAIALNGLYSDLHELVANEEFIPTENIY